MSFALTEVQAAVAAHGPMIRVVVAEVAGSAPREIGASMLVWATGQQGTIGGGALEYEAAAAARAQLKANTTARYDKVALGPARGQCCGGAVCLLSELWDKAALDQIEDAGVVARALPGTTSSEMPLAVTRMLARARGQGITPAPRVMQGWMIEPVARPRREIWVWGAGHVGRALVSVLAPLPDLRITWIDTAADRFPALPAGVVQRSTPNPALLVAEAPAGAEHLVLTFSHALDLEICHRLLSHGFARLGLIGSATKWARFRSRLAALGHAPAQIARINCPIGDPGLGKHPQSIAIGVASDILSSRQAHKIDKERAG
jgi:xanthine dehydrogenase accessory factor